MANKYGGTDDLSGEAAFLEQLVQCLSILSMRFDQIQNNQEGKTHVLLSRAEFEILKKANDRSVALFKLRREERKAA